MYLLKQLRQIGYAMKIIISWKLHNYLFRSDAGIKSAPLHKKWHTPPLVDCASWLVVSLTSLYKYLHTPTKKIISVNTFLDSNQYSDLDFAGHVGHVSLRTRATPRTLALSLHNSENRRYLRFSTIIFMRSTGHRDDPFLLKNISQLLHGDYASQVVWCV